MEFSVENLPAGLSVDSTTGQITGALKTKGEYHVILHAKNSLGSGEKKFRIVVGEQISLTPAMGWNNFNCWAHEIDQEKMLRAARAMVSSGLINHGWTYINIDDTWQGKRTGKDLALQANERFPDLKGLCDQIHQLGLKAGIYSTPWVTAYAGFPGGSTDKADGTWIKPEDKLKDHRYGKYFFAQADANQWAAWGFDYLKYDWDPNDVSHTTEVSKALRKSGRDIVFSLSNTAPFDHAADWARLSNSWRTTCDIRDWWVKPDKTVDNTDENDAFQHAFTEIGFAQDRWTSFAGPGHWNDLDMMVVGYMGWGLSLHETHLTHDEQYSHVSLWCMLSSPLLLGCDLEKLDDFTLSLLSNDEVLALDQDSLGRQAARVAAVGAVDVFMKELEDGSKVLGFFNRDSNKQTIAFDKMKYLGFKGPQHVRDLWRQQDLADIKNPGRDKLRMIIPAHGVKLYKITAGEKVKATQS